MAGRGAWNPVGYHTSVTAQKLAWQSRLILWLVVVPVLAHVVYATWWYALHDWRIAAWSLGLSALLGLLAWASRSGTLAAALTGALICASLMFSTFANPNEPWRTAVVPVLAVLVLTSLATSFGRKRKERMGIAEEKHGRNAAQVCANLGFAALVCMPGHWFALIALASLAEAAADTVSSEIGQVLGGKPFLLTSLFVSPLRVEPGTDGAISLAGTLAGVLAACSIAATGFLLFPWPLPLTACVGGVFGLFFDSFLGETIERKGWLNNDAVNSLSTASAAFASVAALIAMYVAATGGDF
jgi:uncharacterized protein (TIGR00297 family)